MAEDLRCCGTGTCLINAEGVCWCGQRWDGTKMCFAGKPYGNETAINPNTPAKNADAGATPAGPLAEPRAPNLSA